MAGFTRTAFSPGFAIDVEVDFQEDQSGETIGHTWVEFTDALNVLHVWSKIALPDPASYYGGYKEDRVLRWSTIKRALSDRRGQYEGTTAGFVLSDTDRALRALYGGLTTKFFKNRPFVMRMISDAARRALEVPRTIVRAIARSAKPLSPLHFEILGEDYFAQKFVAGSDEQQIPRRLNTRADRPNCPTTAINLALPIIYGEVSDEGSSTAPPLLTGTTARGAYYYGQQVAGYGDNVSDAAVPTGVSAVAASGGTLSADVPNSEYAVIVTAVDASGRESNPAPFYYNGPGDGRGSFAFGAMTGVVVNGSQKLQVSWNAAAGASKYRVYLAWFYYGARFQQRIEVNAPTTSAEFTAGPAWTVYNPKLADITPGASFPDYSSGIVYYAVSAVIGGSETGRSSLAIAVSHPYRRKIRVEWLAVAGATAYRIYRMPVFGDFDRKWEVPATQTFFDDDMVDTGASFINGAPAAKGAVPVIYVGPDTAADGSSWHCFAVCAHAVKEIASWYAGGVKVDPATAGVTWAIPGKTGFSTYWPNTGNPQYRDINGHRATYIYVRGADADAAISGARPITLNVKGIESVGDGSGALITDALLQYRHALQNWLIGDYQAGVWLASPTFPDDATLKQIDEASFDTASAVAALRISVGYVGAFILGAGGERISLRDAIARFNVSCDVNSGFNRKTQFSVAMENDNVTQLETGVKVTQVRDIFEGSFDVQERDADFFNIIPYLYAYDYAAKKWSVETQELRDTDSITDYGEEKRDQTVELHMIRSATVAADVISRRLIRSSETPRLVVWLMGLAGLSIELGDIVLITHTDGIGAQGWTDHPVRVLRHEVSPDQFTVRIEADDAERLFGGFILGDETVIASSWLTASAADRRYGYLADETTGLFGDGAPIKRLR